MDAKELRIGNYVYRQSSKMIVNRNYIYQIEVVTRQTQSKYEPIPLTEEILPKLGFIQSMALTNYWSEDEELNLFINHEGINYAIPLDHDGNFWAIKKIKYVHQLQNLYNVLTGKELVYNG